MADVSYHRLLAEFHKRDNFVVVFRDALEEVAGKVDFSRVKSCLAFGTSSGEREIVFARRLLPNLRSFVAVEPDPYAVEALRASVQQGQLPGVETTVVETSIESWSGADNHVDAVLLFNVLSSIKSADRKALFQKLATQHVSGGGIVAIANNITSVPSGYVRLMERLGKFRVGFDELEEEMASAGFRVAFRQDFEVRRDLSNSSDELVQYFQMATEHKFSDAEVRTAIDEIFSQPDMHVSPNRLAIFTK